MCQLTHSSPSFEFPLIPFIPNTCTTADLPTEGLQLNHSLPFKFTSSNNILYLNCTGIFLCSLLNCTSSSLCHTYVNASVDAGLCKSDLCCTFRVGGRLDDIVRMRVMESGCRAYRSFVNLDETVPVGRWGILGLEIQSVSPPEPLCGAQGECDHAEATCGPAEKGLRRCFCKGCWHWDPIAGVCAQDVKCRNGKDCSTNHTALIAEYILWHE